MQKHRIQLIYLATSLTQVLSTGSKWVLMNIRVNYRTERNEYGVRETSSKIKAGRASRPMNTDTGVPWSGLVKNKCV